ERTRLLETSATVYDGTWRWPDHGSLLPCNNRRSYSLQEVEERRSLCGTDNPTILRSGLLRLVRRLLSYYGEVRHLHRLIALALPGAFSHSITSSAIASSVGGTVRPSALTEVVPWLGAALGLNYPFGGKPVAQSQPRREKESAWRRFNGYDDVWDAIRVRAQRESAQGSHRVNDRHDH